MCVTPPVQAGLFLIGRAEFVTVVMGLLGLEVGDHTRARLAVEEAIEKPVGVKRRRRAGGEVSRLRRRAERLGLEVQPAGEEAAPPPPGLRRCGICRQPGHRVQTCPVAKQQLATEDKLLHAVGYDEDELDGVEGGEEAGGGVGEGDEGVIGGGVEGEGAALGGEGEGVYLPQPPAEEEEGAPKPVKRFRALKEAKV